ncbi:MAG TPA: DUF951 domain-containing protein [Bacillota bacterium]|nr:DUF951 domain-containing protein [Bacillota bacterium]HOH10851.1 DUF951 domain-containing protein [Bacillota bacterium]HOS51065.1 DUF951 domain-containing protein [Bacillota bacterium]HOY88639.1 DUF951 domain-containing protein [Bacillota bacterium]HPI00796.1 DUF951 domain-containing protein [Bacillota bacterium]
MVEQKSYFPYNPGDVVRMKKKHPCGSFEWQVLGTGVDYRIKCMGCGRQLTMARGDFERQARAIVNKQ